MVETETRGDANFSGLHLKRRRPCQQRLHLLSMFQSLDLQVLVPSEKVFGVALEGPNTF